VTVYYSNILAGYKFRFVAGVPPSSRLCSTSLLEKLHPVASTLATSVLITVPVEVVKMLVCSMAWLEG
jgi:hypothetical protein